MSTIPTQLLADTCYTRLASRALELGVILWRCDPSGTITDAPSQPDSLVGWCSRDDVRHRVAEIAKMARARHQGEYLDFAPGCQAFVLTESAGGYITAIFVGLVLEPNVDVDSFPLIPEAELVARANPEHPANSAGLPIAMLGKILRWSLDEEKRLARDQKTIDQLSDRLMQAYEEVNLLFRMAKVLNCSSDPAEFLKLLSKQLQEVFPFDWVGIQFHPKNTPIHDLAGKLILIGNCPIERDRMEAISAEMISQAKGDAWTTVLTPAKHELARQTGNDVIAEPISYDKTLVGALIAGNKNGPDPEVSSDELQFLAAAANFIGIFHENISRFDKQKQMFLDTVRALTAAVDAKDPYTCGHSERVSLLASQMAHAMGLGAAEVETYRIAGLVHDAGKIGVPEAVLCKTTPLTDAESSQAQQHPEIGHRILRGVPLLAPTLPGVLYHHERWDGQGYPRGLAGEKIPLIARVVALVDAFDAMSSIRPYRPTMPRDVIFAEIRRHAGSQFDPALVPTFLGLDFTSYDKALALHVASKENAA